MINEEQIRDCTILLERALKGQTVCTFGEDGCGQHGRSSVPAFYQISVVRVYSTDYWPFPTPKGFSSAAAQITLSGYSAALVGHILTDKNFQISIRKLLSGAGIDPNALSWGPLKDQLDIAVTMQVHIEKLLGS